MDSHITEGFKAGINTENRSSLAIHFHHLYINSSWTGYMDYIKQCAFHSFIILMKGKKNEFYSFCSLTSAIFMFVTIELHTTKL